MGIQVRSEFTLASMFEEFLRFKYSLSPYYCMSLEEFSFISLSRQISQ